MTLSTAAALLLSYLLPGPVLLRQFGARRAEAGPAQARLAGTLSLFEGDARALAARTGLPLLGERADRLDLPAELSLEAGRCTLTLGPTDRPLAEITATGGRVQPDPALPAGAVALAADGCLPFIWRGAGAEEAWTAFLQAHGASPHDVAFTRFDGQVAYAIGGPADGRSNAVLVLSEDGLVPLRLLVKDGASLVDVRCGEYRPTNAGGAIPGRIALFRDGAAIAAFSAEPSKH